MTQKVVETLPLVVIRHHLPLQNQYFIYSTFSSGALQRFLNCNCLNCTSYRQIFQPLQCPDEVSSSLSSNSCIHSPQVRLDQLRIHKSSCADFVPEKSLSCSAYQSRTKKFPSLNKNLSLVLRYKGY